MNKYNALILTNYDRFGFYEIKTYIIPQGNNVNNYGRCFAVTNNKLIDLSNDKLKEPTLVDLLKFTISQIKDYNVEMIIVDVIGLGIGVFDTLGDLASRTNLGIPIQPIQLMSNILDTENMVKSLKLVSDRLKKYNDSIIEEENDG